MTSIIRYKYKTDREFESVQIEGASCSLGELKQLILEKSSKSGTRNLKHDFDLIITDANTNKEYKSNMDLILRNTSVIVARRMRGNLETLTAGSHGKSVDSLKIVEQYIRPAIEGTQHSVFPGTVNTSVSSIPSDKLISPELSNNSINNEQSLENENETNQIKNILKLSQTQYSTFTRKKTFTCHNCDKTGHLKHQCPLNSLISNSNTKIGTTATMIGGEMTLKNEGVINTGSSKKPMSNSSHIITNQAPYQMSHHHHHRHHPNTHRSHNRGPAHQRSDPPLKKLTGIPRNSIIPIPAYAPGAMVDQTGNLYVSRQMAEHLIEQNGKKAETISRNSSAYSSSSSAGQGPSTIESTAITDENPPEDLLCSICKKLYTDAVITPCCLKNFCDECIRNALIHSDNLQCPECHLENVAVDQLNPNISLRKYVDRWRDGLQRKLTYNHVNSTYFPSNVSKKASPTMNSDGSTSGITIKTMQEDSNDSGSSENSHNFDGNSLSKIEEQGQQTSTGSSKSAPIVIRMQLAQGRESSPQTNIDDKKIDLIGEDGKTSDTDQSTISSGQNVDDNSTNIENKTNDKVNLVNDDSCSSPTSIENEKVARQTPPSQVAPVSDIHTSPPILNNIIPSISPAGSNYYTNMDHIPPHLHGIGYPQQLPSVGPGTMYPMQQGFYQTPIHLTYPGTGHTIGGPILSIPMGSAGPGLIHPYSGHPPYTHHPMMNPSLQLNSVDGYHPVHYDSTSGSTLHYPGNLYPAPPGPPLITPHQSTAQTLPNPILVPMSKHEFYMKQKHLQRNQRSSSRNRSNSRSLSSSSFASSTSSYSNRRRVQSRTHRNRSSRSHSSKRINLHRRTNSDREHRREKDRSPINHKKSRRNPEDNRKSSSIDHRRQRDSRSRDQHPSRSQKISSQTYRSTRENERKRSPRPPPTLQQSIQRTIVYNHDSTSKSMNNSKNLEMNDKSRSLSKDRLKNSDDCTAPLSKREENRTESKCSSSPAAVPSEQHPVKLSSKIESVSSSQRRRRSRSSSISRSRRTKDRDLIYEYSTKKKHRDRSKSSSKHKRHRRDDESHRTQH